MIILKTPKGWTGPKEINGKIIENSFKAHQVPITITNDSDLKLLEKLLYTVSYFLAIIIGIGHCVPLVSIIFIIKSLFFYFRIFVLYVINKAQKYYNIKAFDWM